VAKARALDLQLPVGEHDATVLRAVPADIAAGLAGRLRSSHLLPLCRTGSGSDSLRFVVFRCRPAGNGEFCCSWPTRYVPTLPPATASEARICSRVPSLVAPEYPAAPSKGSTAPCAVRMPVNPGSSCLKSPEAHWAKRRICRVSGTSRSNSIHDEAR
jgi:hypothetical protein